MALGAHIRRSYDDILVSFQLHLAKKRLIGKFFQISQGITMMTQEEFFESVNNFIDATELGLLSLSLVPLDVIFAIILGGITIVSYF